MTILIQEDIPNGLRVELKDSDMPFGRPRQVTAYEGGGTLEHEKIYFPGSRNPIYQVQQARERDWQIHGAFRDHLWAQDTGQTVSSHARDQMELIDRIRRRGNPIKITRGQDQWFGLLTEAKFGIEGDHDITYEITFAIAAVASTASQGVRTNVPNAPLLGDLSAAIAASLASRRAQMAALAVRGNAALIMAQILNALDLAEAAANDLTDATVIVETSTASPTDADIERVETVGNAARSAIAAVNDALTGITAALIAPTLAPSSVVAFETARFGVMSDSVSHLDAVRTIRLENRRKRRLAVRLYIVQPGDTLESIALKTLGDISRASEFGIRADELTEGLAIRIPEAA